MRFGVYTHMAQAGPHTASAANHGSTGIRIHYGASTIMRVLVLVVGALIGVACANSALSAPPYDVTATFSPASGQVDGYRLYQGCRVGETKTLVGPVISGQTFNGLLTAPGEYSFCAHAFNAAGEGPSSNVAVVTITDLPDVPGAPQNFQIVVTCQQHPSGLPSCAVNVVAQPAP